MKIDLKAWKEHHDNLSTYSDWCRKEQEYRMLIADIKQKISNEYLSEYPDKDLISHEMVVLKCKKSQMKAISKMCKTFKLEIKKYCDARAIKGGFGYEH